MLTVGRFLRDDYIFKQGIFFMALPKAKGKSNAKFKKTLLNCTLNFQLCPFRSF